MSSEQIVISGDGLIKIGQAVQTAGMLVEKVQKYSEIIGRIQVSPMVRSIGVAIGASSQLFSSLSKIAQKQWGISVRVVPVSYQGAFAAAGTVAGGVFLNSFLAAFDASKIAEKAKTSMDRITVNVKVEGGSGSKSDLSGDFRDVFKDIISGFIAGGMVAIASELFDRKKGSSSGKPSRKKSNNNSKKSKQSKSRNGSNAQSKNGGNSRQGSKEGNSKNSRESPLKSKSSNVFSRFSNSFKRLFNGGSNNSNGFTSKATPTSASPASKQLLKFSGKLFRPLAIASDVANIASAKPGDERNAAIGKAVGGAVGATALGALGTMIMPGVGTAVGTYVGDIAGDWIGEKIGSNISKIKKFFSFGNKEKRKAPEAIPEPTEPPSDSRSMNAIKNAAPSSIYSKTSMGISAAQAPAVPAPINVSIMNGAVQLSLQQNQQIDYAAISAQIGAQLAVSIRQSVENRA